jgi:hypothetical protein
MCFREAKQKAKAPREAAGEWSSSDFSLAKGRLFSRPFVLARPAIGKLCDCLADTLNTL